MKFTVITCDSCTANLPKSTGPVPIDQAPEDRYTIVKHKGVEFHFCDVECLTRWLGPAAITNAGFKLVK